MNYLQQVLSLPYAQLWIPGVIFASVGGGLFWFLRQSPGMAVADGANAAADTDGAVRLKTAHLDTEPAPIEQRKSKRRQGNPVDVRFASPPEEKAQPKHGCVLDRSLGGIRLAVYDEFAAGTLLAIRPTNAIDMVPWIDVEVRSCRPSSDMPGEFDLGCQFVKSPPFSILMMFG